MKPILMQTGDCYKTGHNQVGFVEPNGSHGVVLRFGGPASHAFCELQPGESGVVVFSSEVLSVTDGGADYTPLNLQAMCKLQAFFDLSLTTTKSDDCQGDQPGEGWGFAPLTVSGDMSSRQLDNWMIYHSLTSPRQMKPLAAALRRMEYYWLVKFLIEQTEQTDSSERLQDLGERYGVSVSHFRRLARRALGNSTKVELKSWRMAKALLDYMGTGTSLTDLAMKHGYSSLSHFSNDVKIMFGISPRGLKSVIISEFGK